MIKTAAGRPARRRWLREDFIILYREIVIVSGIKTGNKYLTANGFRKNKE
jgi:hypothetical protein